MSAPSNPSPSLPLHGTEPVEEGGPDPDLLALPAPRRRGRTATVVLMFVTAVAAIWMAVVLSGEARYALTAGQPLDLGNLAEERPAPAMANRYVQGSGVLGAQGTIRYSRAAEGDTFRLAPIEDNPSIWVEIRIPEGLDGPRFVPPQSFAGRLVPFREAGVRHGRLARAVHDRTGVEVPSGAWLLIDGASPRASRWAVALFLVFVFFAGWNFFAIARVLARIRESSQAPST